MSIHLFSTFLGGRPILFPQKIPAFRYWSCLEETHDFFGVLGHAPMTPKRPKPSKTRYQMRLRIGFIQMKVGVWCYVFNENSNHLEWNPKWRHKNSQRRHWSLPFCIQEASWHAPRKAVPGGQHYQQEIQLSRTVDQMKWQVFFKLIPLQCREILSFNHLLDLIFQIFPPRKPSSERSSSAKMAVKHPTP